ncbi:MAG: hypothetical protein ACYDCO_26585, partial [Armatimonadota bacterium]
ISEEDAIAEGCRGVNCYRDPRFTGLVTDDGLLPTEQYAKLWDVINGKRAPFSSNPWVLVYAFERMKAEAQ